MSVTQSQETIISHFGKHETELITVDVPQNGPTIFIGGGIHGGEIASARAASRFANAIPSCGTLHVVPRWNPNGLRNRVRGNGPWIGDLNDCFPANKPAHELKPHPQAMATVVRSKNIDYYFGLHTSAWARVDSRNSGVGDAIYPSPKLCDIAEKVTERITNEQVVTGESALYSGWA